MAVTNPGTQASTSGTAITPLQISASDTQSGATLTFGATGLPAGLSISTSGNITGTPTTACACSVTVTATDGSGYHGSATFTWNITNTVTVTNPGTQNNVTGTAISTHSNSATDSSSTATISSWSATGLPAGLSINTSSGAITGTPTTPCACSVTIKATDSAGYSGTASFTWNITNTVAVTNPGTQASTSGTAITPLQISASDTQSGATLTFGATGLPAGLSISTSGNITGTPTTACACSVTVTATDGAGYSGSATFAWNVTNAISVTNPGSQTSQSGTAITSLTISASDSGSGTTLSYSAGGTLPPGLAINSSTGKITGTPTTGGLYSVAITVTDGTGASGSTTFNWTVNNVVTVTSPGNQSSVSGTAISPLTISASDSSSATTLSYSAGGTLPPGLAINSSTGKITGTPTTAGTSSVTITATDTLGYFGTTSFTWTVTNTVTVTSPGNQSDVSGTAITPFVVAAADSSSTATLAYSDGGTLPPGLSIDVASGTISGTPTTGGTYTVTITATDGSGASGSATFTWTVTNTVTVTSPGDQSSAAGTAISPLTVSATDTSSTATLSYSDGGTLPPGLSIDASSGQITGTPTTAGSYPVTITASDNQGFSGTASFTWTITSSITVTNPGAQTDGSGTAITPLTIQASDSSAGSTLSYSDGGTLPPGLSIDSSTGKITGTPTTGGAYSVTITVSDNYGQSSPVSFTWTITNTVSVTSPGTQSDVSGTAITPLAISASDSSSTAALTYSDGGTLPPGLAVDPSSGVISGTPTTAGSYPVTITATDGAGYSGSATFTWTITNTVTVTGPGDQSDVSGTAITPVSIAATDTSSTATLSYTDGGTLPPGLAVDPSSGVISGTPTTGGSYPVTLTATDDAGFAGSESITWVITNVVTVTSPGDQSDVSGTAITPLAISASDSSSTATLTYSDGGTLPPGLAVDPSAGVISGTPTTGGSYPVTVTVSDDAGYSSSASFTWTITNTVTVTSPGDQSDPSGTAITPVPVTASDSSSTATLTYSDGGTLPPGLSIDPSSGQITGTPTTAGSYPVTITVSDDAGYSSSASFTWTITNTVTVTNPGDQSNVTGTAISPLAISASDSSSSATLTYSDGGTLPPGLAIDPSAGVISGTPTTAGSYSVTITATDGSGASGSTTFTWTVTNTVTVTSPGDQSNVSGTAITPVAISASDSSSGATLTYSDGGTLPPGLSIDPNAGTISGTPTTAGSYSVTITATDDSGASGSTTFTWTVTNTVSVTSPGNQLDDSGTAISPLAISAADSSSTATLTYSDGGTLPPGLSIDPSSGVISGNPTTGGTYSVTITATDGSGASGSASFTWTIHNVVTVNPVANQTSDTGSTITPVKVTATDSQTASPKPVLQWTATGLPPGLSIEDATGNITGAPTAAGTYSVTVTATERAIPSDYGSTSFTWTVVNVAPTITSISPKSGPGAGGTKVKISGTRFNNVTAVMFGSVAAEHFKVNKKGTKVTAYSPAEPAGTVDITVTAAGGTSSPVTADQFTFGGPTVTEVNPSVGSTSGGTTVVVSGSDLGGATAVHFGSVAASSFSSNAKGTKLTVVSPAQGAGTVDVVVTTPGGTERGERQRPVHLRRPLGVIDLPRHGADGRRDQGRHLRGSAVGCDRGVLRIGGGYQLHRQRQGRQDRRRRPGSVGGHGRRHGDHAGRDQWGLRRRPIHLRLTAHRPTTNHLPSDQSTPSHSEGRPKLDAPHLDRGRPRGGNPCSDPHLTTTAPGDHHVAWSSARHAPSPWRWWPVSSPPSCPPRLPGPPPTRWRQAGARPPTARPS